MAKKLVGFCVLVLAAFLLADKAQAQTAPASSAEINPIAVRGYSPVTDSHGNAYFDFYHDLDAGRPQLNNLLQGSYPKDAATGLSQIAHTYNLNEWDYTNSQQGSPMTARDAPVTMVGLATTPGQTTVHVPLSGREIAPGYQVVVAYASADSIALSYRDDGIIRGDVNGYAVQLGGLTVDPELVVAYNRAAAAGQRLMLAGDYQIGYTTGNELLLVIRDTGSFMDPRWKNDWWANLQSGVAGSGLQPLADGTPLVHAPQGGYCETPAHASYPDESREPCSGDGSVCRSTGNSDNNVPPTYVAGNRPPEPELRQSGNFTYGIGVQGLACGQARGDSLIIHEVAPYDLFREGKPSLCEGTPPNLHEWTGESMPSNINIPFAQPLAEHWAGRFDIEHYSEGEIDEIRKQADMANVHTDADLQKYFDANKKIWNEQGLVAPFMPKETQDKLKADFIKYVKSRNGSTLYANVSIRGTRMADIESAPEPPDPEKAAALPQLTAEYQTKFDAWREKWRDVLDVMPLFPNEEVKSQIKVVVCGDREYDDAAMSPNYPEVMKMGLAANSMFQQWEPESSQKAFYKKEPLLADPLTYLQGNYISKTGGNPDNYYAQHPEELASIMPAGTAIAARDQAAEIGDQSTEAGNEPPKPEKKNWLARLGDILVSLWPGGKGNIPAVKPAPVLAQAGACFDLSVAPKIMQQNPDGSAVVHFGLIATYLGIGSKAGPHINNCTYTGSGGDARQGYACPVENWKGAGSVFDFDHPAGVHSNPCTACEGPDVTLKPGGCVTRNFYIKIDDCADNNHPRLNYQNDGSITCRICLRGGEVSSPDINCNVPPPPEPTREFSSCDSGTACCVTPYCQPKKFPNVRFGPPLTIHGNGGGDLDYGWDWPPSGAKENPVKLIFKKEDWHAYSDIVGLPGECSYRPFHVSRGEEPPPSCTKNSDCPGWGSDGGWACKPGSPNRCSPISCAHPYDRTVDVYNNVPYLYSVWQQVAGKLEDNMPAGILALFKPKYFPATNGVVDLSGKPLAGRTGTSASTSTGTGTDGRSGINQATCTGAGKSWASAGVQFPECRYVHGDPANDPNLNPMANQTCSPLGRDSLGLCRYGYPADQPPDPDAPQLNTITGLDPTQPGSFASACRLTGGNWEASFLCEKNQSCTTVRAPVTGHHAGGDAWDYLVVYADAHAVTLYNMPYDANEHDIANHCDKKLGDYVLNGYGVRINNINVDPNLVAEYQKDQNILQRRQLPVVKSGDILGWGTGPCYAITDTDDWMDPRSVLDWWHDYSSSQTVACKGAAFTGATSRGVTGVGCTTDPNIVFDNFGNFLKIPGAAKVDWGYFSTSINGQPPHLIGIDVNMDADRIKNLLFYRLAGVCDASKWWSEKVLNPAGPLGGQY